MFYQSDFFLNDMIQLIKECNTLIMDIYNQDFKVLSKQDNSPITIADMLCNKKICLFIKEKYLDDESEIISEENKNNDYNLRKNKKYVWLIDPLDGTKEFVKKNGEFTVNIGLCKNNIPVFGIVSIPASGEIYYGIENKGSFKINNNIIQKLSINQNKNFDDENLRIVASSSHCNTETKEYISKFKNPQTINIGSSIKLLLISENKADIYPRLGPTNEWDTCAAHAVVKYAGGNVFMYNTKNEILYNKKNLLNTYFIVY